jgi:outer membrane protein W
MKKKYFTTAILVFAIANTCVADTGSDGKTIAKIKAFGMINDVKSTTSITAKIGGSTGQSQTDYPNIKNNTISRPALGFEAGATYFFTNNFATEITAGLLITKFKASGSFTEKSPASGHGGSYAFSTKVNLVPINIIAQYHMAPYGTMSPYIGAGYSYLIANSSTGSDMSNIGGPVFQAGFDAWVSDNVTLNLEVKKSTYTPKLSFNIPYDSVNNRGAIKLPTEKLKINPLMISIGMGYRF